MTHGGIPEAERLLLGIGPDLIRVSVGIEDPEDLVRDIEHALEAAVKPSSTLPIPINITVENAPAPSEASDESPLVTRSPSVAPSENVDSFKEAL
ncbi:hypothetical protein FS842_009263 [Serendipita sp. 407]|nr:hypothetical protein FS842_009263 [Serendipita sp. 407]